MDYKNYMIQDTILLYRIQCLGFFWGLFVGFFEIFVVVNIKEYFWISFVELFKI